MTVLYNSYTEKPQKFIQAKILQIVNGNIRGPTKYMFISPNIKTRIIFGITIFMFPYEKV